MGVYILRVGSGGDSFFVVVVEVCEGAAHNDGDASGVWVCFLT